MVKIASDARKAIAVAVLLCMVSVHGNVFLGKDPDTLARHHDIMSLQEENALLTEVEKELGGEHRTFTEKRLEGIKSMLKPIFASMVQSTEGKIDLPAMSYVLRRLFLQRHGWYVKDLEPTSKSFAAWSTADPARILADQVSEHVTGLFDKRLRDGVSLHEIAVLAATFEHLVHKESLARLQKAYESLKFSTEDVVGKDDVVEIMDAYMVIFIQAGMASSGRSLEDLTPEIMKGVRKNMTNEYPMFPEVQKFLREVEGEVLPKRDYIYFSEVMSLVEDVADRYGRWQDAAECKVMKSHLLAIEDKALGGAGRVRLADFYKARLYNGRYEFAESARHLKKMGSLDDSDPETPKVIIPNYINGPSNCLASTKFFRVCCIDECDDLVGHLEVHIGKPSAPPAEIASIVASLPSATVAGNRTLPAWLLQRLDEVASHHNGQVPLHGRMFAQWMHYAYPRECPYPHAHGEIQVSSGPSALSDVASKKEMHKVIAEQKNQSLSNQFIEESASTEQLLQIHSGMWTMEEELVSVHPGGAFAPMTDSMSPLRACIRGMMMVAALVSVSMMLVQTLQQSKSSKIIKGSAKFYV